MLPATTRLQIDAANPHRRWDDELVVFHRRSGNTHLLDLVASEAYLLLAEAPRSIGELEAALAERLEVPLDEDLKRYVSQLAERLELEGLFEVERT